VPAQIDVEHGDPVIEQRAREPATTRPIERAPVDHHRVAEDRDGAGRSVFRHTLLTPERPAVRGHDGGGGSRSGGGGVGGVGAVQE
jgi:hypothetical protein